VVSLALRLIRIESLGKKRPTSAPVHPFGKVPRTGPQLNVPAERFRWRVDSVDWDGPWGWETALVVDLLDTVIPKLHDFESMTWAEVEGKTGSHFVAYDDLCKEAQDRLTHLRMDEQAQLFSARITGKKRVWGTRDVVTFRVLWWDPDHTVCPSLKD